MGMGTQARAKLGWEMRLRNVKTKSGVITVERCDCSALWQAESGRNLELVQGWSCKWMACATNFGPINLGSTLQSEFGIGREWIAAR
jgi:hypothetical protein